MANTFILIASSTVGSGGASSIDFTNIPQTYTDLLVVLSLRGTSANLERNLWYTFNNTTANRSGKYIEGTGSAVGNVSWGTMYGGAYSAASSTANAFSNFRIYIPKYSGSSYKPSSVDAVMGNMTSTSYLYRVANLWSDTAAITSIEFPAESGTTFAQYSTAQLYGIKNS